MKYIDLHVHSNVSDGTLTPSELVDEAIKNNIVGKKGEVELTDALAYVCKTA